MIVKKTLGQVLKRQRKILGLSQAELARQLGVKPSHVAYLEKDQRRPSLSLLSRLADVLGLEKQALFLLARPEASALIGEHRERSRPHDRNQAWRGFVGNKALLARYEVSPQELKVLSQVNLLGKVTEPRHYFFILNAIRQAVEEE
jgi:transcriptional regulator with XRE-family HTH domain